MSVKTVEVVDAMPKVEFGEIEMDRGRDEEDYHQHLEDPAMDQRGGAEPSLGQTSIDSSGLDPHSLLQQLRAVVTHSIDKARRDLIAARHQQCADISAHVVQNNHSR